MKIHTYINRQYSYFDVKWENKSCLAWTVLVVTWYVLYIGLYSYEIIHSSHSYIPWCTEQSYAHNLVLRVTLYILPKQSNIRDDVSIFQSHSSVFCFLIFTLPSCPCPCPCQSTCQHIVLGCCVVLFQVLNSTWNTHTSKTILQAVASLRD